MSVTFRIATAADDRVGPVAVISARQLAAFRRYLREESARTATVLLDPDAAQDAYLAYRFDARVCPLALAAIARVLAYDDAVITIVEKAQFRGRRVSVHRHEPGGPILLEVSPITDCRTALDLAPVDAQALLESLGIRPDPAGRIPIDAVRARLADPSVRSRAATLGTATALDRLDDLLAASIAEADARLEWA